MGWQGTFPQTMACVSDKLAQAGQNSTQLIVCTGSMRSTHWLPLVKLGVVVLVAVPSICATIESKQCAHMDGSVITSAVDEGSRPRGIGTVTTDGSPGSGCSRSAVEEPRENLRPMHASSCHAVHVVHVGHIMLGCALRDRMQMRSTLDVAYYAYVDLPDCRVVASTLQSEY